VRIIAPFEVRLKRIMAAEGGDEKKAARLLNRSDRDSAGFLRSFFEVDWEDRNLYDLVINTDKLLTATGMNLIVESISSPEILEGGKTIEAKLSDLALTQKVEVVLMRILGIGFGNVTVAVKGGIVNLSGQIASEKLREDVLRATKAIDGVQEVNGQFYVYAQYYGP
jgi:hypothetical protein